MNQEIHLVVCDPEEVDRLENIILRMRAPDDLLGGVGLDQFEGLDENQEGDLTDAANETPITLC